jgi:hypothetical protein
MNRLDTESASSLGHIYSCRRTNTDYCIYLLQTFSGVSPEFLRPNNVQTLAIRQFLGAVIYGLGVHQFLGISSPSFHLFLS